MQRYTELIEQADQQLYRAKREGKNCCRFTAEKRGPARK
jgi:PleD family two-component response regulator